LWRLPGARTKNKRPHVMPLCPLALAELAAVWPAHGDEAGNDWRLLGTHGNGFVGFSKLKARVDSKAGIAPWRWHDLRRTVRTGLARLGVDRLHAERALNHVSGQSRLERTYDTHDYEAETLAALRRWQAHVASLVLPAPGAEVVPLRRTRT
jgi:integrase